MPTGPGACDGRGWRQACCRERNASRRSHALGSTRLGSSRSAVRRVFPHGSGRYPSPEVCSFQLPEVCSFRLPLTKLRGDRAAHRGRPQKRANACHFHDLPLARARGRRSERQPRGPRPRAEGEPADRRRGSPDSRGHDRRQHLRKGVPADPRKTAGVKRAECPARMACRPARSAAFARFGRPARAAGANSGLAGSVESRYQRGEVQGNRAPVDPERARHPPYVWAFFFLVSVWIRCTISMS